MTTSIQVTYTVEGEERTERSESFLAFWLAEDGRVSWTSTDWSPAEITYAVLQAKDYLAEVKPAK